ncbi:squamosa promoter-binding protein 1-like protein [Tanacetum coccineum]|uniref:Squamosa promoter-binding protein 1-like protein n=1 Tax=Tanacetum coccineum TaxID=301880 RepID=A0ABQ5F832_9ASTR
MFPFRFPLLGVGEDADEFLEGVRAAEEDDYGTTQFERAFTFSVALTLDLACCQLRERYTHGGQFARSGGEQSADQLLRDHVSIGHSSNAFGMLFKQGSIQLCCRIEGCTTDMTNYKTYRQTHKVCEIHAKAPIGKTPIDILAYYGRGTPIPFSESQQLDSKAGICNRRPQILFKQTEKVTKLFGYSDFIMPLSVLLIVG